VRPFNIIGIGMPLHGAVQSFARQIADIVKGRRSAVVDVGNLDTSRDFVAVDDVVRVYWRLLRTPAAYGQVINVCSGIATSMRDVLAALLATSDVPIAVRTDPARVKAIDIDRHYGSVERLQAILGDSPQANVGQTLRSIVEALVEQP
jgi:GDP-4-dehydro-6-deoxy-D-mannose reductase